MGIRKFITKFKYRLLFFIFGIGFALIAFITINAVMKPFSKSSYCGTACHEMNTAYQTWEISAHGANKYGFRAECIDCHLPSKDKYFTHLIAKSYEGAKDMYMHYFGGEYNGEHVRQNILEKISDDRCTGCHKDLLAKPSNSAARLAQQSIANSDPDTVKRCVTCHENLHERDSKLFLPDIKE